MTLNLSALPIGTRLRTRDGRSARLLATDLKYALPIVVAVDNGLFEDLRHCTNSGRRYAGALPSEVDIVSVEEPRAMLDVRRK